MQGHFDLKMLHTPGLTRDLIEAVRREGGDPKVEEYIKRFQQDAEWHTDNLVYQTYPSYLYFYAMSGPSKYWGDQYSTTQTALALIHLSNISSEPAYSTVDSSNNYAVDAYGYNLSGTPTGIVQSTAIKQFINDCIVTPDIKSDGAGREAIYGKFKWLFLPGECTSDQIRSIDVWYSARPADPNYAAVSHGRIARVRIKDSGGNPVTINKIATKSLLIEYTFTMVSI